MALACFLGIENSLDLIPFRALVTLYSYCIILRNDVAWFSRIFSLSLTAFGFSWLASWPLSPRCCTTVCRELASVNI